MCWRGPAGPLDAAGETPVRTARTPAHLDLALAVLTQRAQDARALDRHWPLPRERARDEAQRAARPCSAVAPEPRLVARTLARRGHEQRQQVAALDRAQAEARRPQRLEGSPPERQQMLPWAAALPAVWTAPPPPPADRKARLRGLVPQMALTPADAPRRQRRVQVRWQTEATTERWGPRPGQRDRRRTPPEVVEALAHLATGHPADRIAAALTARGRRSGRHRPVTRDAVAWIRDTSHSRQPGSDPQVAARTDARPAGRYSTRALATHLGVTISTVHDWRQHGSMPAIQESPGGPWWHAVTPAVLAALHIHLRRVPLRTDDCGMPNAA
jgi:hypothetical protein